MTCSRRFSFRFAIVCLAAATAVVAASFDRLRDIVVRGYFAARDFIVDSVKAVAAKFGRPSASLPFAERLVAARAYVARCFMRRQRPDMQSIYRMCPST